MYPSTMTLPVSFMTPLSTWNARLYFSLVISSIEGYGVLIILDRLLQYFLSGLLTLNKLGVSYPIM